MSKEKCGAKDPSNCRYHTSKSAASLDPSKFLAEKESKAKASPSEAAVKESYKDLQGKLAAFRANPSSETNRVYRKAKSDHDALRKNWLEAGGIEKRPNNSEIRNSLASKLSTEWSLDKDEFKQLEKQVDNSEKNVAKLTEKDKKELEDLSAACEDANFHSQSIKLGAVVGMSRAIQKPQEPLTHVWEIVYQYSETMPEALKSRIKSEHSSVWERAINSRKIREEQQL